MTPTTPDKTQKNYMDELLDSFEPMKPLRRGDVIEGIVMRADPDGIFVNIGHKSEGVVPPGEMRSLDKSQIDDLELGDEIMTLVVRAETADSAAILSIDRAIGEQGWRVLEKAMEAGDSVSGVILGFNRGGAIIESEGVQGFVPMSQLVSVSRLQFRDPESPESSADAIKDEVKSDVSSTETEGDEPGTDSKDIGKKLELKVLEVNRSRNRAIFSERQMVQDKRDAQKAILIEELNVGEVRKGKVTGISGFGAFVDLGGADGLIHISELSWNQVSSPQEIVTVGDEIDVYVLEVDSENKKIALSLRRLQPEPWDSINEQYKAGDIVSASITKLTNFGAFARVEGSEGSVEGLIHISELSAKMINHPREVVREGDAVKLKILRIEPERRRLGLSLMQAQDEGAF